MASRCLLCRFDSESLEHIFLLCPFAKSIWSSMVAKFDLPATLPSSLIDMLYFGIVGRSHQLREIWCACYASVIWFIWKSRNKARYDDIHPNLENVCRLVVGQVNTSSRLASGCMSNTSQDLIILKRFGVHCRIRRTPRIIEVNWHTPPYGCVKINCDGAWKSASGKAGFGGVFRDYQGIVLGAFCSHLDIPSSVAAEVMAVIKAIELSWVRDWKHVWLVLDD